MQDEMNLILVWDLVRLILEIFIIILTQIAHATCQSDKSSHYDQSYKKGAIKILCSTSVLYEIFHLPLVRL